MRYEIGEEIGRGAIGRVVRVTDRETGDVLAGKVLHESHQDDEAAATRFLREAELTGTLVHENVARIFGIVSIDGRDVLLMELVDGPSLVRVLAEADDGKLPEGRVIAIGRGIAAGLGAAHRAGIVHRDLKPANVLLAAGDVPRIVDFGMARATSFVGVERGSFALVGTPDYMAPECVDPLAVDPRSDLYALGCILYELVVGRPPFSGATAFSLLEAHQRRPVPEVPGASRGLATIIRALLSKSPADRPQSAAIVVDALAAGVALAMAPQQTEALASNVCVECGAALVPGVGVCFACGKQPLVLEAGDTSVFVVGPGAVAQKLDSALRAKLLAWLRKSPQVGLDPAPLAKRVPRLPFVVATGLSEPAAQRLSLALRGLGLQVRTKRGGAFALPEVQEKAWRLAGRRSLIGLGMLVPMFNAVSRMPALLPAVLAVPIGLFVAGYVAAVRRVALPRPFAASALPPKLAAGIGRVTEVVPVIEAQRHREGLRAVVQRLLSLREAVPAEERARLDEDLERVLALATAAAVRVDELERRLAAADMVDAKREELRERDAWAARLLEAAAQLDALRARWAAAQGKSAESETDEALARLRAEVEAFEEVQKL